MFCVKCFCGLGANVKTLLFSCGDLSGIREEIHQEKTSFLLQLANVLFVKVDQLLGLCHCSINTKDLMLGFIFDAVKRLNVN